MRFYQQCESFVGATLHCRDGFCNFAFDMIDPELYSLSVNPIAWGALGLMVSCMLLIACVMWPKLRRVRRQVAVDDETPMPHAGYPGVSVIVYSQGNGTNLRTLLPQILNQDYPAPMEVIVVNDESADDTESIVSELELKHPNLYMTFAPEHSRNLSRRKLSITLGIKAARHDVVVLTCGNCRISSATWLRSMTRHMIMGKEVVIGYAVPRGAEGPDEDVRRRRRSFDFMWQSVRALSSAICGHPFMGTGYNLAYTRRIFFRHKGFSKTLHLNYGDDDLFVNEISTKHNTAVELGRDARVEAMENAPARLHDVYRRRRDFTSRMLPRRSYRSMGLTSLLWWIWPVAGVAAGWIGMPSLVPATATGVIAIIFLLISMSSWKATSKALGLRPLFFTVPWLALTRPLRTLRHRIAGYRSRKSHLTHVI